MTRALFAALLATLLATTATLLTAAAAFHTSPVGAADRDRRLIAHRGASAYAPEHTLAAYRLAIEQHADYVEQDLAVTRDGVLICIHDDTLERTTDVEDVFPDRATVDPQTGRRRWLVPDFTLAEIKRLDAGSWFNATFAGERVPTWQEAVAFIGTKAGLYPELKTPALYRSRNIDMAGLLVASLNALQLPTSGEHVRTRLVIQSFDERILRDLAASLPGVPRMLLIDTHDGPRWLSREGLTEVVSFAGGIGPSKDLLDGKPELVRLAHELGLVVTPYTFRSASHGRFTDVRAEMRYYLSDLGVDELFTDNPDQFPR